MFDRRTWTTQAAPHLVLLCLIVLPLFVVTGRWGVTGNVDAFAAAAPAWQLARNGTLDMSPYGNIRDNVDRLDRWFVETETGAIVSNRPPGVIGIAVPAYAIAGSSEFANGPAVATAIAATSLALLMTWKVLQRLVGRPFATASVLTLAFGTTTWWISSAELWPHGPGQLWASLAVTSLASGSYIATGLWFGLGILTRPLTALFAAAVGVGESVRSRDWKPLVRIGLTSAAGLGALMFYNRLVFGSWSAVGGYSEDFTTGAMARFDLPGYLSNVASMFIGPRHGVLTTSPIVGVSLVGLAAARRSAPGWVKSAAYGGLVYLLAHALLNRASGGLTAFYRYPLEALILAAPGLAIGAHALISRGRSTRLLVIAAAVLSIGLQMINVIATPRA